MQNDSVAVVAAWQDAVNRQDLTALLHLSDPAIELVGPRGSARGHAVLGEWLERAGLRIEPLCVFVRGPVVVVAQHGVWWADGNMIGEAAMASRFEVHNQRVTLFARYDDLETALMEAGLTEQDEQACNLT